MQARTGFAALWDLKLSSSLCMEYECAAILVCQHVFPMEEGNELSQIFLFIEGNHTYNCFKGSVFLSFNAKFQDPQPSVKYRFSFTHNELLPLSSGRLFTISYSDFR